MLGTPLIVGPCGRGGGRNDRGSVGPCIIWLDSGWGRIGLCTDRGSCGSGRECCSRGCCCCDGCGCGCGCGWAWEWAWEWAWAWAWGSGSGC
jgi:hypothetical protein